MSGKGWIRLHRKIRDNPIFNDHQLLRLWMICLTEASHKERDQIIGKQTVHLMPGEFVTGRYDITDLYNNGLKNKDKVKGEKTVFRWLETLESGGFLTIKKTNKFSVISIDKWDFYQGLDTDDDHEFDHQMTNKRPSNDHQMTTNNNVKNYKNVENEEEEKEPPSPKNPKRIYSEDELYYRLSKRFHELALKNAEEAGTAHLIKEPNYQSWSDTFRLMFEKDKVKETEIGQVVKYALSDSFYRTIIFSPKNLRKHYLAILTKMNTGGGGHGGNKGGNAGHAPTNRANERGKTRVREPKPVSREIAQKINSFE